jgi:3-methyladenine DNA glycosylase AlkD
MASVGIGSLRALGVSMPEVRRLARETGRDHDLAAGLWASGVYEARLLAGMVEQPKLVTESQVEEWAAGFDNWAIVDGTVLNVLIRPPFAHSKAAAWSGRQEEFVKRAAFALMAVLAVYDKKAPDGVFEAYLPIIEREASDDRPYVRKAVNWALRQIGKRNKRLNGLAVEAARRIQTRGGRAATWVASDALRELTSEVIQGRLKP